MPIELVQGATRDGANRVRGKITHFNFPHSYRQDTPTVLDRASFEGVYTKMNALGFGLPGMDFANPPDYTNPNNRPYTSVIAAANHLEDDDAL